jgi:hypothetical protein
VQRGCVDRAERVAGAELDRAVFEAEHSRGRAEAHRLVAGLLSRESV